jgi:D-alanyl-D-alanine carboxypeptidase
VGWEVSRVAAWGLFVFRVLIAGAIATILSSTADARQRHRDATGERTSAAQEEYTPPAASIVIDGGNGTVLQASGPNLRCHPASLTKVMTLYLLFERLEAGELHLGDFLTASEHAS